MCTNISNLEVRFYKMLLQINPRYEQEDRGLSKNFKLYENKHPIFSSLLIQSDRNLIADFFIALAVHDQPVKEAWEPENRREIAWRHLQCFCGEFCYRVVERMDRNYGSPTEREENFDHGKNFIYNLDKFKTVVNRYDKSKANFETYMRGVLDKHIRDVRGLNRYKYSPMRLLCEKSSSELKSALERQGHHRIAISQRIFARRQFKIIYYQSHRYNPTNGARWEDANTSDYAEAAEYYNSQRMLPNAPLEVFRSQDITSEEMQQMMQDCIQALLASDETRQNNIDYHENDDVENDYSLSSADDNMLEYLEGRIDVIVRDKFPCLKEELQKRAILYYGFDFNQKKIEVILSIHQTTISKSLTEIQGILLQSLCPQGSLGTSPIRTMETKIMYRSG